MAQSVIGALRVNLGLDSAQFNRGAKAATSSLGRMRAQFLAVAGVATAMGTALSAAALKGAREIDRAAKAARRIGASVAGYRALEMAADDAGVSLASLANDVQTMNRELERAALGEGNAGEALERIGMAAADFAGLDADQRVALLADRVQELGLNSGQTTLLLRDLGVRNREMALLVMGGGEALRRARRDVEEFGLALSDVDAARIEAANDEISGLADITTYVGDQLALKFVPAMGDLAKAMTDSLREGGVLRRVIDTLLAGLDRLGAILAVAVTALGVRYVAAAAAARLATLSFAGSLAFLRGALIRTGIGALVVGAGELIYRFSNLVDSAGGFGNAMSLLGEVAAAVWQGIVDSADAIPPALQAVFQSVSYAFQSAISDMLGAWSDFLVSVGSTAERLEGVTILGAQPFEGMASSIQEAAAVAGRAAGSMQLSANAAFHAAGDAAASAGAAIRNAFGPARDAVQRLSTAVSDATAATQGLDTSLSDLGGEGDGEGGGGGGGGGGSAKAAAEGLKKIGEEAETAADAAKSMDQQFGSMFASLVTGASSASDVLGRLGDQLLNSAFTGISSALGLGSLWSTLVGNNANGTRNWRGGLTMVGERGPELVNLPQGAQVFNRHASAMATGGGASGRIVVELGAGLEARILEQAGAQAIDVVRAYDKQLPTRVHQTLRDGRNRRHNQAWSSE